jgi:hypothetical protein
MQTASAFQVARLCVLSLLRKENLFTLKDAKTRKKKKKKVQAISLHDEVLFIVTTSDRLVYSTECNTLIIVIFIFIFLDVY